MVLFLALGFFLLLPGPARPEVPVVTGQEKEGIQAMTAESAAAGEKQAAVSLEQAIRIAKDAFTVPEDFDQFSTGFSQSDKLAFWELRWYHDGEPGGSMTVRVNSETGEIWGMDQWKSPPPGEAYLGPAQIY